MLITKSRFSLNSIAPDRLANMKPEDLAKAAKSNGWPAVVMADERTMAGALAFLMEAKSANVRASAGVQVSRLRAAGALVSVVIVPLTQSCLDRIVPVVDAMAKAQTLAQVLDCLPACGGLDGIVLFEPWSGLTATFDPTNPGALDPAAWRGRGFKDLVA